MLVKDIEDANRREARVMLKEAALNPEPLEELRMPKVDNEPARYFPDPALVELARARQEYFRSLEERE